MRRITLVLSLIIFISSCGEKDSKQEEISTLKKEDTSKPAIKSTDTLPSDTAQQILDIQNEFKKINSGKLSKKKFDFACKNDPAAGTALYYLENNKVVKITVDWGFAGDYATTSEYYFKDEKLIFIHDVSIGGPADRATEKTEERTYINNDKTIRVMRDQKILPCTTCVFSDSSKEYKIFKAYNSNSVSAALCE